MRLEAKKNERNVHWTLQLGFQSRNTFFTKYLSVFNMLLSFIRKNVFCPLNPRSKHFKKALLKLNLYLFSVNPSKSSCLNSCTHHKHLRVAEHSLLWVIGCNQILFTIKSIILYLWAKRVNICRDMLNISIRPIRPNLWNTPEHVPLRWNNRILESTIVLFCCIHLLLCSD